ncbi:unnamed protein product [Rhizophagus irregularis]|uniref:Uncharacterized protein n=1 Tax=Rhizophagus irregularis TaxID=588596 RepID=A0A915ZGK3_9GLOM|nr:unnamed protein product [Rhizophagus irregularis]
MQHNQMNESLLYRANRVEDWNDLLENEITVGEGQDEDGEDDEDYEDGEDGEDGDYGDDDDEQSDDEKQSDDEEQSDDKEQSDGEEQSDDEEQDDVDTRSEKLNFPEDDYESLIVNLHALITYLNHANIHEVWRVTTIEQNKEHFMAMFHIGLIPDRWYNEKFPNFQEEPEIAIYSEKNTVNPTYEHQIRTDFSLLHEIRHTQAFSETAKQNLSHKAKYNQGFGYAKKAIGLALEIGCEDELNGMLQRWIREKENETRSRQLEIDKENLPNIIRRVQKVLQESV